MATRIPVLARVSPGIYEDTDGLVRVNLGLHRCAELPQAINGSKPRLMRKTSLDFFIQVCLDNGAKVQTFRGSVKLEALTGSLPIGVNIVQTGIPIVLNGDPRLSSQDIKDTLIDIVNLIDADYPFGTICP